MPGDPGRASGGLRRVPPGRSGELWLKRRLTAARRGVDLLDQKLRMLRAREAELEAAAAATEQAWVAACSDAQHWLLRGALLGGEVGLRAATVRGAADVTVAWTAVMGVRYPAAVAVRLPDEAVEDRGPAPAALHLASGAYRAAVTAGAEHAAADRALFIVRRELARTRRQLRGVQDRWVPRLEDALAQRRIAVDDLEHDDAVRRRWAAQKRGGSW